MKIDPLVQRYGLVSDQVSPREVTIILDELRRSLPVTGAVVEFGCYKGTTSLYLRRVLDAEDAIQQRPFHVYDSFEGLPPKAIQDQSPAGEQFTTGELNVSKKQFIQEFVKAGLRLPVIHKAWFDQLTTSDIPDVISFAFLDGDYYQSIKDTLRLIGSHLAPGAVVVVDDYANEALPGAARAVDEWCKAHGQTVRTAHSLGIIHV